MKSQFTPEMVEAYNAAKASARRRKIQAMQDKGQGAAFFSQYKRIPSGAQDEFRRLLEEDWREHRKFDADPSEEIIEAEVIEE